MSKIVLKFGGTSLGNANRIGNVCKIISNYVSKGHQIVVVVSAMGGVTDYLVSLTKSHIFNVVNERQDYEYDVVLSTGENISAGLVSMHLNSMGIKARSLMSWQLPIEVSGNHKECDIEKVNTDKITGYLDNFVIPVITGFQGVNNGDIYTIGRGGSDTSAVSIAKALGADKCYIYTDVEGVFTSDPRIVPKAKKIEQISYDEMLELAQGGAKVLHPKSVRIAKEANIDLEVLSSFSDLPGTKVLSSPMILPTLKGISTCNISDCSDYNNSQFLKGANLEDNNIALMSLVGYKFFEDKYNIEKVLEIINDESINIISTERNDFGFRVLLGKNEMSQLTKKIHSAFGLDVDHTNDVKEELDEAAN